MPEAVPSRARGRAPALLAGLLVLGSAGCRGCTSSQPPIHVNPSMDHQPKYRPQAESAFFYDGATMRPPVPGTVARGELREDQALYEGKDPAGKPLAASPVAATPELLARGADRYHVYCEPCHDPRGDGKGILFVRGNIPTASFHADTFKAATDGHIFDVITNGYGLMPAYKWPLAPADRWAIVAHVRELQRVRLEQTGGTAAAAASAATPAPAPSPAASPGAEGTR
jgi:hypothetical protein